MIYWLIGQPGAGKTTLAKALLKANTGGPMFHIDGDGLRETLKNFDYSESGRVRQNQSVVDIARYLSSKHYNVVISVIGPYKRFRDELKKDYPMKEIYVHTSDKRGREDKFVEGFELPTDNYIDLDTTNKTIEECLKTILGE